MRYTLSLLCGCLLTITAWSQNKKPLDHSVYDSWQSLGERAISNNGQWMVYSVNVQEGDNTLYIQHPNTKYQYIVPRGYGAVITADNNFVICKIKPTYKEQREARVKKKRPDEMPKDTLAIIALNDGKVSYVDKIARVKSFAIPEKYNGEQALYLTYLLEKAEANRAATKPATPDSSTRVAQMQRMADSLQRVADSVRKQLAMVQSQGWQSISSNKENNRTARPAAPAQDPVEEGADLVIRNLATKKEWTVSLVSEYTWHPYGKYLAIETTRKNGDTAKQAMVLQYAFTNNAWQLDTLLTKFNDAKIYAYAEYTNQLAFLAERDSAKKESQKFYGVWLAPQGSKAILLAHKNSSKINQGWSISENANLNFSANGKRLFIGTAPILPPKDTSLPEFERVSVDVWHYQEDQLQTQQLYNLQRDLRRSYLAVIDLNTNALVQLADSTVRYLEPAAEGNSNHYYAVSDTGRRVAGQWQGYVFQDVYYVNALTQQKTLLAKNFKGNVWVSYSGNYALMYNEVTKKYIGFNALTGKLTTVATDIPFPLYDEENDVPDHPNSLGIAKWMLTNNTDIESDRYVVLYDKYDMWKVDVLGLEKSVKLSNGRTSKTVYRLVNVDRDEKYLTPAQQVVVRSFSETTKQANIYWASMANVANGVLLTNITSPVGTVNAIIKAKQATSFVFTHESFQNSPNWYYVTATNTNALALSALNPQQQQYTWGTAELFTWKAYTGKLTEGVLYKPEGFDTKKKYPMIVYFYERNNETLHNYQAPAPTPSRLNIPFFVSRGYIVFVPDIWYTKGKPGQSAYDYIVSGTRALIAKGWVDSNRIGLQGQSWGGYQTAQLITKTKLYKAAWAGAPVANMFSAYGGIRWESGLNRQFQYEHQQSRIGYTIWERPDLYIENSPLFHLPKVQTPLVIMHNDADGAVPWYQGIELFTGLRRLQKPVWMLNYNGEAHNLIERKNRKDIQIREQQFFDWLLQGAAPAPWLKEGVPAVMKGRTMGL